MPTDSNFWVSLFEGVTPTGKIILFVLLVLAVLGGKGMTILASYIKEARDEAKEGRKEATLAAERSLPTANGFAQGVKDQLETMMATMRRMESAGEQTQTDVAAIKAEQKRTNGDVRRVSKRVEDLEKPQP